MSNAAMNAASHYDERGILAEHKLITISNLIGQRYPELGYKLGISPEDLHDIKTSSPGNLQTQVYHMLSIWRNKERQNATMTVLNDAVKELGWTSVYTQIRNTPDNFYVPLKNIPDWS